MDDVEIEPPFDSLADEAAERAADAAARADIAAGQLVRNADVVKWLNSWGKPNEFRPVLPSS